MKWKSGMLDNKTGCMEEDKINDTRDLIIRDFELPETEPSISEEELFQLLANRIALMIERELEILLSLMYRLDINEAKVHHALSPLSAEPANIALAKLVWERQKQRAYTKKFYKQKDLDNLDDLDY